MENPLDRRQEDRRTEKQQMPFEDRRAMELRRVADRAERNGQFVTAAMFRNAAFLIEQESKGVF